MVETNDSVNIEVDNSQSQPKVTPAKKKGKNSNNNTTPARQHVEAALRHQLSFDNRKEKLR